MPGTVEGKIVAVTDQGNLVSDIAASQLEQAPRDEQLVVVCDEHETHGLFDANHNQPESTFIAVLSEDGCLDWRSLVSAPPSCWGSQSGS